MWAREGRKILGLHIIECMIQTAKEFGFDYHGTGIYREDGKIYGDGVYQNNVTWNTRPNEIKGDRHLILNNTVINSSRYPNPFKEVTISLLGILKLCMILKVI